MILPVRNTQGEEVGPIEVQDELFGVPPHPAVVHQALVRQQANARQGDACAKTRGEVIGSTHKPHRQKHTGWARAGSVKSPLRRGGGKAFPPRPRSYRQGMPKKMHRLALKSALSDKVREGGVIVTDGLELSGPRTKEMGRILSALGAQPSVLVVTAQAQPEVIKSARNLPGVKTLPAPLLNVADLLFSRFLVITVAAVRRVEEIWGRTETVSAA